MNRGVFLIVFALVAAQTANAARKFPRNEISDKLEAWREFEKFWEWKIKARDEAGKEDGNLSGGQDPAEKDNGSKEARKERHHAGRVFRIPPVDQPALMARFIVNQGDWASVATISTRDDVNSFPVANVKSVSDGPLGNGTGVPYMYLTPLDFTAKDLAKDPRSTLLMTLAQTSICKDQGWDPMDPRCARVMLSGEIKEIKTTSPEYEEAKSAIFGRHPWLELMPEDHHFFFAKLEIGPIVVVDTFGGAKYVSVDDYFNPPSISETYRHRSWNYRGNRVDEEMPKVINF